MSMSKEAVKAIELAIKLVESYPLYSTTFSPCSSCHNKPAKGGMECSDCLEDDLAALVGYRLAKEFHDQIKMNKERNEGE
jgi:hypothetical protein